MPNDITRRYFLKQSSCAAIGTTTLMSTLANLKFMNAASISNSATIAAGDYKALVCILLSGGNDSFNMLVPMESGEYGHYESARTAVAIPRDSLHQLNGTNYGVHPSMAGVQELFNQNHLSFISNIGTLISPVSKPQALTNESLLPLGLFSHSDQVQQWQTSVPHDRSSIGWGGKIADLMQSVNANPDISMNISLGGSNIFQTGNMAVEYAIDRDEGAVGIINYENPSNSQFLQLRDRAIDNIVDSNYNDIFQKTYIDVIKKSRDANKIVSESLSQSPFLDDIFSNNDFSSALQMVARMIAVKDQLGAKRQIFFVEAGGFDNHDELLDTQAYLLEMISNGLKEFNDALIRIGAHDCVTTFTSSEFGRTLTFNGEGTDHAWGGNVMVMGGPVQGGNIFGEYPLLELGGELELSENANFSNGIMIPTTSVDEYFAELALWYGVQPSELSTIFPNIGNFYNTGSGSSPIGFLK